MADRGWRGVEANHPRDDPTSAGHITAGNLQRDSQHCSGHLFRGPTTHGRLWHGVEMLRALNGGWVDWSTAGHALYFVVVAVLGTWAASVRLKALFLR